MNDHEFIGEVNRLRAMGDLGKTALREFLKLPGHLDRLFDMAIAGAGRPRRAPRHKARTELPPDYPDEPQKAVARGFWAMRKRADLSASVEDIAAEFRDYHLGRGTLSASWGNSWATWYRQALKDRHRAQVTAAYDQTETLDVWRWRVRTFHHGDEEQAIPSGYWKPTWGPKPGEPDCRAPTN